MTDSMFLYPNVTRAPGTRTAEQTERLQKKPEGAQSEFDQVLARSSSQAETGAEALKKPEGLASKDLNAIRKPLKFSSHASQRLKERNIRLDTETMTKVNEAIDKAESKGLEDTLVLTKDAALIVNVSNRTVITAMDKGSLNGNVFTNIDGAVIVS